MSDWRDIKDFPGYAVNEYGAIFNKVRGAVMKPRENAEGFLMLGFSRDGVQHIRSVALVVAEEFLEDPPSSAYNSIIHLNGDRTDCRAFNLMYRPRWFAFRYHKMFKQPTPYRMRVYIPQLGKTFATLREFCTTYGLIESQAYDAMVSQELCYPGGWFIERSENS